MPRIEAYLTFDGTCAEAMRFYERALGGRLETLMTHAESPMADRVPQGVGCPVRQPCAGIHGFAPSLRYSEPARPGASRPG
jgi:PhnB protein